MPLAVRFLPRLWPLVAVTSLVLAGWLMLATVVFADVPGPQGGQALPSVQFWTAVLAAAVPLVGYVLNHYAPWVTEPVKWLVQTLLAAAVGVIYPLVQSGSWAFDTSHLQLVGTALLAALVGHIGYKTGAINLKLGGGTNAQGTAPAPAPAPVAPPPPPAV